MFHPLQGLIELVPYYLLNCVRVVYANNVLLSESISSHCGELLRLFALFHFLFFRELVIQCIVSAHVFIYKNFSKIKIG